MKSLQSIAALFLTASILFTSCKKDKDQVAPPPANTIEGTWVGKVGSDNNTPASYYSFIISKDGTMKVTDDSNNPNKGTGTWTMDGDTFKGQYQNQFGNLILKYNVVAKFKAAEKRMDGSWGTGTTDADDGTFFLDKQ